MLATVRKRVRKQKQAGRSVEEVVAAKPAAEFDAKWEGGLVKANFSVGSVYSTL